MKRIEFFQSLGLQAQDYKDLANAMKIRDYDKGEVIYSYNSEPKQLYIVLNGSVGLSVKNRRIDQWAWARNIYEQLLEWKEKEFDKKVKTIMHLELVKIKLRADTNQLMRLNKET